MKCGEMGKYVLEATIKELEASFNWGFCIATSQYWHSSSA